MTALEMLRDHSLNPGWFGHPGTITLYGLALVSALVGAIGVATGRFADTQAFTAAIYADPGIVFLPGRLLIVACGVACVLLTYRIGVRICDRRLGLIAAFFLAINAVHIEYSQIIRTDIQASAFMLLCALCSLAIVREGRLRHYVLAGICVGLACATKWPAAVIVMNPICAILARPLSHRGRFTALALLATMSVATLLVASPYLLLDYPILVRDLTAEMRPVHPGATGFGFFGNLVWYAAHPLRYSLGTGGLILAVVGTAAMAVRDARARAAVLPGSLAFLIIICAQSLVWERWVVPLLPFAALAVAYALTALGHSARSHGRSVVCAGGVLLSIPMLSSTWTNAEERRHDTRQIATAWVRAHVPPGATLIVENAAFDLLQGPWRLLFPIGSAGCVDVRQALGNRIRYSRVEKLRSDRPIVDIGNVDMAKLATCRADYLILSHYTRYATDRRGFAAQLTRYRWLMRNGKVSKIIRPTTGYSSGPDIVIVTATPSSRRLFPHVSTGPISPDPATQRDLDSVRRLKERL